MKPEPTRELLVQAGEGNARALDTLLSKHRDGLRRMVEKRLDRAIAARVDASDIVQESLLEASRRLARYVEDPPMPFGLWLRQIARDRLIDAHRHHRLARRRSVDRERSRRISAFADQSSIQLMDVLSASGPTPRAAAIRAELRHRFEVALAELDDGDREILLMRHLEGLSNRQIAELLELREAAASMRYLRSLKKLRALLGACVDDTR